MPGGFPWSVLGIEATHDVGEIRRAYARRLRAVRPDEDPEGFQELVQAREMALKLASQQRPRELPPVVVEQETTPPRQQAEAVPAEIPATITITVYEEDELPPPPPVLVLPPVSPVPLPASPEPAQPPVPPATPLEPLPPAPIIQRPDIPPPISPQALIAAANQMFASGSLNAWRQVFSGLGELPQGSRAAVEARLLGLLAEYARKNQADLAHRRKANKPFFEMLAALNAEFGWRERDRVIYNALGAAQADAFVALLERALRGPQARDTTRKLAGLLDRRRSHDGFTQEERRDSYYFFDQNNDLRGLAICRKLLSDPDFWRRKDASTALFVPSRPNSPRDALALLTALLGWLTLLAAFLDHWYWVLPIPVVYTLLHDVQLSDPPRSRPWASIHRAIWPVMQVTFLVWILGLAATLYWGAQDWLLLLYAPFPVIFGYCAYSIVRLFIGASGKRRDEHPAWETKMFALFPFIAYSGRYYARAAAGFLAWAAALSHQAFAGLQFFAGYQANFGHLVLLALLLSLHLSAGYNSGRWLVLRFLSTTSKADGKNLFKPELRAAYLLKKGTGANKKTTPQSGSGYRSIWWWIVIAVWALAHLGKLLGTK